MQGRRLRLVVLQLLFDDSLVKLLGKLAGNIFLVDILLSEPVERWIDQRVLVCLCIWLLLLLVWGGVYLL